MQRQALHVSPRLSPFLPCALASADCIWPFPLLRLLWTLQPDAPETIDDKKRCTGCPLWRGIFTAFAGGVLP